MKSEGALEGGRGGGDYPWLVGAMKEVIIKRTHEASTVSIKCYISARCQEEMSCIDLGIILIMIQCI